jgi:uncharacterized damage-inducible protein DinB
MAPTFITPDQFVHHWQSHRGLTRRVIEAFPEDQLFTYSIGGMRPFSELALEMIFMAGAGVRGIATRQWAGFGSQEAKPATKQALLDLWDETTTEIDTFWPQIPASRFEETDKLFNAYDSTVYGGLLYFVDNEIHHRGQGYVYLRGLGIEPPPFWDRH